MAKHTKKRSGFFNFFKQNWPITLIVLILIIFGLILISVKMSSDEEKPFEQKSQRQQKTALQMKVDECDGLGGVNERNVCLLKAAKELGTTEICLEISTEENDVLYYACVDRYWLREDCMYEGLIGIGADECWYNKAIKKQDVDFCFKLPYSGDCIFEIVLTKNDPSLCRSDECVFEYAKLKKDISFCSGMEDEDREKDCYSYFAVLLNDKSLCENIICEYNFVKTKEGKALYISEAEERFREISDSEAEVKELKEDLITTLARAHNDVELCEFIPEQKTFVVGESIPEISGSSITLKDACIYETAKNTDKSKCNLILDNKLRSLCLK